MKKQMQKAIGGTVAIKYLYTYDHVDGGEYWDIIYNQRNRQVPCQFEPGESGGPDSIQFQFSYPWYRVRSRVWIDLTNKRIEFDQEGIEYIENKRIALADGGFEVHGNFFIQKHPDAYMDAFALTMTIPNHRSPNFEEYDLKTVIEEQERRFKEEYPEYFQ